ncbi:MAG TPA: hypothetical protein VF708_20225 [Pyrinomonadaceae bacterium]|jgi:hypothetical protein
MLINKILLKIKTAFSIQVVITLALALLATAYLKASNKKSALNPADGFDFTYGSTEPQPSDGPAVGERIDLARFKASDGATLASAVGDQLSMLVIVDPACGACRGAADEMRDVSYRVAPEGVRSYLVSATGSMTSISSAIPRSPASFFQYAESLDTGAAGYLWDLNEGQPPEALAAMVLPSHILVDRNGVIVRKWPGTNRNQAVRKKMANQIVADTIEELSRRGG